MPKKGVQKAQNAQSIQNIILMETTKEENSKAQLPKT
jgi:hypothetical protein